MAIIDRFRGKHAFLSNFYPVPIRINRIIYPTVEHAYQAAKISLTDERRHQMQMYVAQLTTAGLAKKYGRHVVQRTDWDDVKNHIMERLLTAKFALGGGLDRLLLETGDAQLVEGNDWGDTYWGVCRGQGLNRLGLLLMERRTALAKQYAELEGDQVQPGRGVSPPAAAGDGAASPPG